MLVRLSRLGEVDVDELRGIITDAWARRAPKRLVREHLGMMADAPRLAAYDVLRAVRIEDAYANLVLPQVLRGTGSRGATPRSPPSSPAARSGGRAPTTPWSTPVSTAAGCRDGSVTCCGWGPTSCWGCGWGPRRGQRHRRPGPGPRRSPLGRAGQRRAAQGRHRRPRDLGREGGAGRRETRSGTPRSPTAIPAGSWRSSPRRWGSGGRAPDLLAADNTSPSVVLVARPGRAEVAELPGEPTVLSPYGVVLAGGDPGSVPAVAEGRAGVQDEGSQLVALALAAAGVDGEDGRWLDLCAGPGGKAALLAALAAGRGARLVANERQPHRAALVSRALAGADGVRTSPPRRDPPGVAAATFDRVLVDAPCSGLGALRRRPEARWRRQPDDLGDLVPLQRALLGSALDLVRPGGVVLYATCSPVVAETSEVVPRARGPRRRPAGAGAARPARRRRALAGTAQLWPHRHGTDAMFLGLLRRM